MINIKPSHQTSTSDTAENPTKSHRKRDVLSAVTRFCRAYGSNLKVLQEITYQPQERGDREQDYWIGYSLSDWSGRKCGEIFAGYFECTQDYRLYGAIEIDGELIDSISKTVPSIYSRNHIKSHQPNALKSLLIDLSERSARKPNTRLK